jgi:hypothetical protein
MRSLYSLSLFLSALVIVYVLSGFATYYPYSSTTLIIPNINNSPVFEPVHIVLFTSCVLTCVGYLLGIIRVREVILILYEQ